MMVEGLTDNLVKYDVSITGPQGGRFTLFLTKDIHIPEDVNKAKKELRKEQDVVKFYTEWISFKEWCKLLLFINVDSQINKKKNQEFHKEILELKITNRNYGKITEKFFSEV